MTADIYINRVLDRLPRATPRREQIATELRGHIAERTAAGQPEADVLRQLGDPVALAESYLSAVPLVSASFGRRAAAKLIDVLFALFTERRQRAFELLSKTRVVVAVDSRLP